MGAVGGAAALAIVGFGWEGWVIGRTAVAAWTSIYIALFRQDSAFDTRLNELTLQKVVSSLCLPDELAKSDCAGGALLKKDSFNCHTSTNRL